MMVMLLLFGDSWCCITGKKRRDVLLCVSAKTNQILIAPSADAFFRVLLTSLQWVVVVLNVY